MITKLFTIEEGRVSPTMHCYVNPKLLRVINTYHTCQIEALAYCFYMACPYESENPYAKYSQEEKEDILNKQFNDNCFFKDDIIILEAIEELKKLYETTATRYLESIRSIMNKTMDYLTTVTNIEAGRDGNLSEIQRIQKEAGVVLASYRKLEDEVESEKTNIKSRGQRKLGYDELNTR